MANPEHIKIVKKGWGAVHRFFRDRMESWLDLSEIDLSDTDLQKYFKDSTNFCWVDFTGAHLQNVRLSNGNLWENNFSGANLSGANFSGSELCYSEFDNANCTDVNFREADLGGASFLYANLAQADFSYACCDETSFIEAIFYHSKLDATDFSGARFGYTHFTNTDLSRAIGLDKIEHYAPSYLDEPTLAYSKGHVLDSFLIGCGYSDQRGCFVLSSFNDEEFDTKLQGSLRGRGVPCWLIREFPNYYPKDSRDDRVDVTRNRAAGVVAVVCSRHSLAETHILLDIEQILDAERDSNSITMLPVVVDDYLSSEWQHPLKEQLLNRQIVDFKNWQDAISYDNSLDHLIRALQAGIS